MDLWLFVPGSPIPKARARVSKYGAYTPKKSKQWENHIAICAKKAMIEQGYKILNCPIRMFVEINFEPPDSWSKKKKQEALRGSIFKTSKPDISNIVKSVEDALNGVVYKDDSQIIESFERKRYSSLSGIVVRISTIDNDRDEKRV